ncbi:MAG TPA: hypothetical protein PLD88_15245, partial [Candidatus Berkiella sp.]|nr:hypothetical protein [Candidatus Berkiella sp.]
NKEDKNKIIKTLDAIAAINTNLLTFSLVAMIKKAAASIETRRKSVNVSTLLPEVAKLISFILFCGQNDVQTSNTLYQQLIGQFTKKTIPEPV